MESSRVMLRPGGRTESNRKAVAEAVLKLATSGNVMFEAQDIADLAGVHRTTVRRRWPTREALLALAMEEHTARLTVDLAGDWKSVLRRIAFGLRDFMDDPVEDALNRVVAVSASPQFTDLVKRQWDRLIEAFAQPLLAAQKKGRIAASADIALALFAIASAVLTQKVYAGRPMSDSRLERLVKQTIRALSP